MATFEGSPQAAVRITSLSIMVYDYFVTIPSELRLYKRQKALYKPSLACIFFVLARYVGMFYICWVSYVFFGTGWTQDGCARIAPLGTILRGLVSSISAAVFVWRTWAIWGKNRYVWMGMTAALVPVTVFSYAPGLVQVPVVIEGSCTAVSRAGGGALSHKWTFALVNMLFDTLACALGSIPLIRNVRQGTGLVSGILLADGLGYFIVALVAQTLNFTFLLNPDKEKQGTMLTLQTVITAILAQRIITSLSERTSNIHSSKHDSGSRSRSRSGAPRSGSGGPRLGAWGRAPRPPHFGHRSDTGADGDGDVGADSSAMIKVQVTTETLRAGESVDDNGAPRFGEDQKILFA
ncbi:hypothetical protein B0H15DRAFT_1000939 [Mycena belliarum]|uniref:Uncharacterized protein n=1 Tax=Mycena belliarum TaxID=1033014 RepID=A0AAD6TVE5_9AGAR|nr:hypothetical protein B0H15DRAFT_1000939 [Mycena belliae]